MCGYIMILQILGPIAKRQALQDEGKMTKLTHLSPCRSKTEGDLPGRGLTDAEIARLPIKKGCAVGPHGFMSPAWPYCRAS